MLTAFEKITYRRPGVGLYGSPTRALHPSSLPLSTTVGVLSESFAFGPAVPRLARPENPHRLGFPSSYPTCAGYRASHSLWDCDQPLQAMLDVLNWEFKLHRGSVCRCSRVICSFKPDICGSAHQPGLMKRDTVAPVLCRDCCSLEACNSNVEQQFYRDLHACRQND